MTEPDSSGLRFLWDWAAYLVAALAGLLWKGNRDKLEELRRAMERTITKVDFDRHEEREEKDRGERRQAEASIREKLEVEGFERRQFEKTMHERVNTISETFGIKLASLEEKMEKKLDKIIERVWK